MGLAKNKDIAGIEDLNERARLDCICLKIGREFLVNRNKINNIEEIENIVNKYSPIK